MTANTAVQIGTLLIAALSLWLAFRKGRREDLRTDAAGLLERVARLERKTRVLDDYCNALRGDLRAQGLAVRDWPDELTEGGV